MLLLRRSALSGALVLIVHNFRINHIVLLAARPSRSGLTGFWFLGMRFRGSSPVELSRDGLPCCVETFAGGFDGRRVITFKRVFDGRDGFLDFAFVVLRNFARVVP